MIRLLRSLRKDASTSKNIGMYLAYAIGEIVLVVIGILIALQVDNWNKEQLDREKEQKYLAEIKSNLNEDVINIEMVLKFNHSKMNVISSLFEKFDSLGNSQAMIYQFASTMDDLTDFQIFTVNEVAFNNMVSSESIDLIQNDSLKTKLSRYYIDVDISNGTQERIASVTRAFVDHVGPVIMNKQFLERFMGISLPIRNIEEVQLGNNEQIIHDIFLMNQMMISQNSNMENYKNTALDITSMIDLELEQNN